MAASKYTKTARVIHWIMAALILLTIPAGLIMVQQGIDRGLQNALFLYHKNVGVMLLGLVILRLIWRMRHPAPPLPASVPPFQAKIAGLTHVAMYALLFILPIAGYVRVRAGGFPIESLDALGLGTFIPRSDALAGIAKSVHYYSGILIGIVIAMHIGAALYHGVVKRDGVFSRMWPTR